jgi:hypothetical protein
VRPCRATMPALIVVSTTSCAVHICFRLSSLRSSRNLAEWIATSDRGAMNMDPYHGDRNRYKATNHNHEDVMVGRMFCDASVRHTVVKDCRFHHIHAGANSLPLKTTSIGIHPVKPGEYKEYRQRFADAEPARVEEANAPLQAALVAGANEERTGV